MSTLADFTPAQLDIIMQNLHKLPPHEQTATLELIQELQKRSSATKARTSLLAFAHHVAPVLQIETEPKVFMVGPHHRQLAKLMDAVARGEKKRILISVAPRMGKLLSDDTPVMTRTGWKTHGELRPGDFVFHPSGRPVEVLAVSAKASADVRMEFSNGEVIYCHENHEWVFEHGSSGRTRTLTAGDFLSGKAAVTTKNHRGGRRALNLLPAISALSFDDKPLPAHPYMLGAWLGDGTTGKTCITHHVDDTQVIAKLQSIGYAVSGVFNQVSPTTKTTSFGGAVAGWQNKQGGGRMFHELNAAGVFRHKHIPKVFKCGSVEQRLELLAGLIDTDGTVDPAGRVAISTVLPELADDIEDVVNSLGWRPYRSVVASRKSSSGIQGRSDVINIGFNPTFNVPTALPRKRLHRLITQRRIGLMEVRLDPQGKVGHCIQVDSADGLYLAGKKLLPTHNSLMSSYLFPAWYLGQFPNRRIIMASHTGDMATGFGRKVRDLISTPDFQEVFPDVSLKADSKAAGQWATSGGGEYYAVGVGGALAGRGADLVVVDDPFSEQAVISGNTDVFEDAWTWFQSGPLQRLSPTGAVVIIHTRWNKGDLIGKLIDQMTKNPDSEQWEVVEFPAILNEDTPEEKSLWPERWPLELLKQKKAVMAPFLWNAQYMQSPTGEAGALIKREWWRDWDKEDPPSCEYIIMSIDAAQEAHTRADFNACQVWGVFFRDPETGRGDPVANVILLDAWKKRMEYPELKKTMLAEYAKWEPDTFVIEKKSSGSVLYQEFRNAGLPVSEFTPGKGQDKIARVNSVSDIFESGLVWAPLARRWAQEVVEECSDFPNGDHDDQTDAMTLALRRFRTGGFIRLPTDEPDEESYGKVRRSYY